MKIEYDFNSASISDIHYHLVHQGYCLLRNAIPKEIVADMAKRVEEISSFKRALVDKIEMKVEERFHIFEDDFKRFHKRRSLYELLKNEKWHQILMTIIGKKTFFTKGYFKHPQTNCRGIDIRPEELREQTSFRPLKFHIDAAYHEPYDKFTLNCWVPLNPCGKDSPGIQVIPLGYMTVREKIAFENAQGFTNVDDWTMEKILEKVLRSDPSFLEKAWAPEFNLGDVMLMTSWVFHASYAIDTMTLPRRSIEVRHYGHDIDPNAL